MLLVTRKRGRLFLKDGLSQIFAFKTDPSSKNQQVFGQIFSFVAFISCITDNSNKKGPLLVTSPDIL